MGYLGKTIGKAVVAIALYGLTNYAAKRLIGDTVVKAVDNGARYKREHDNSQPRAKAETVILKNVDFTVR